MHTLRLVSVYFSSRGGLGAWEGGDWCGYYCEQPGPTEARAGSSEEASPVCPLEFKNSRTEKAPLFLFFCFLWIKYFS